MLYCWRLIPAKVPVTVAIDPAMLLIVKSLGSKFGFFNLKFNLTLKPNNTLAGRVVRLIFHTIGCHEMSSRCLCRCQTRI